MTADEIARLRELAEAFDEVCFPGAYVVDMEVEECAAYVAALPPEVVLRFLDELDAMVRYTVANEAYEAESLNPTERFQEVRAEYLAARACLRVLGLIGGES